MKSLKALAVVVLAIMTALSINAARASQNDPDPNFDRLDGTGKSGKRVDVIEWEGNLEVHVYPKGSLAGLALKLDKKAGTKEKVMVIGYRFTGESGEPLVRRAILGIEMREGFQAFKDPSADDYDKVVISNNGLAEPMIAFKLDGEPAQLYPEGHPANAERELASGERDSKRMPAKARAKGARDEESSEDRERSDLSASDDEEGRIKPFFMERKSGQGRSVRGGKFDP